MKMFRKLSGLLGRATVALVLVSLFLAFVYTQSTAGEWLRREVEAIGKEHLGDAPGLPSQTPWVDTPSESGSGTGASAVNGEAPREESESPAPVVPLGESSDAVWIASVPATLDLAALDEVEVAAPYAPYVYDRGAFGASWADVDGNGCGTRDDVLARDLSDVTMADDGCEVLAGFLADPYMGTEIAFELGVTSEQVHVDHVVALEDAWDSGAWAWSAERRLAFANDPRVLVAVNGGANMAKGSRSISEWQPGSAGATCRYGAQYLQIVTVYELSVSAEDAATLRTLAAECD